jgi:transcriptional regulator with XRE-family HTH domain
MAGKEPNPVEPFPDRVKRLAAERGMSVAKLSYLAYDPDAKGTNPDTLRSVMAGRRRVTPALIEALARVLDVEPTEFPEYRLADVRRRLDEREVGLDEALRYLERIEQARKTAKRGGS